MGGLGLWMMMVCVCAACALVVLLSHDSCLYDAAELHIDW